MTTDSLGQNSSDDVIARLVHEALEQLGWRIDAQTLAKRIRQLDIGLPAEDEFSVLVNWLGNCSLVHKLDQMKLATQDGEKYQVPDLLAVFEHSGHFYPVLIEVKSKRSSQLSWRRDYFEGLQRYSDLLTLPVLVAWKYHEIWMLFELSHFRLAIKNYNIDFETAMRQNLMGLLAGDFIFTMRKNVGLHLKMHKESKAEDITDQQDSMEQWLVRIDEVHFTDGDGRHIQELDPCLWFLFLSSPQEETSTVEYDYIYQSFIVSPEAPLQFCHRALAKLLQIVGPYENRIRWRELIYNRRLPISREQLRRVATDGISTGFVQYVGDLMPATYPTFLR